MITASVIAAVVGAFLAPLFAHAPTTRYSLAPQQKPELVPATIIFGGDMMFDRYIRTVAEREGDDFILSCVDHILQDADLVVANLEGPITSNVSVSVGTKAPDLANFTFTFPTSTAALLARHNIGLVNLGNNHIMNFSRAGLLETKQWLDAAGVRYFGDPDVLEAERVARIDIRGVPFSFVNWSDWTPVGKPAASNGAGELTIPIVERVRAEKEAGRVPVIYTHWGDEYLPRPEHVKQLARSFVDAGAAIVIGSHPHVVQEHEMYKGKHIYYSLGNFVFDQYFDEQVRNGLLLRAVFEKDGVANIEEIPIELQRDGRTCPIE